MNTTEITAPHITPMTGTTPSPAGADMNTQTKTNAARTASASMTREERLAARADVYRAPIAQYIDVTPVSPDFVSYERLDLTTSETIDLASEVVGAHTEGVLDDASFDTAFSQVIAAERGAVAVEAAAAEFATLVVEAAAAEVFADLAAEDDLLDAATDALATATATATVEAVEVEADVTAPVVIRDLVGIMERSMAREAARAADLVPQPGTYRYMVRELHAEEAENLRIRFACERWTARECGIPGAVDIVDIEEAREREAMHLRHTLDLWRADMRPRQMVGAP